MKPKHKTIILAIIGCIILTFISVAIQKQLVNKETTITTYKFVNNISKGSEIKDEDLTELKVSVYDGSDNYLKSKTEIVGRVAKENIYVDEVINKERLIAESDFDYFNTKGNGQFGIDVTYFDDTYSLSMPTGTVVDLYFTSIDDQKNVLTEVKLKNVTIVGRVDSEGKPITETKLAQSIIFESEEKEIINITQDQYKGKFKLVKVPLCEQN